jgi:O-antigen ligase
MLLTAATLAFGAVYPWGYIPLFAAATLTGVSGVSRQRGIAIKSRALTASLLFALLAVGAQLVPLPRSTLDVANPHGAELLSSYSVGFVGGAATHPISIVPPATLLALVALGALTIYLTGAPGTLSGSGLRTLPRNLLFFAVPLALFGIFSREQSNGLIYWFWKPVEGGGGNGFGPFVNRNHFAGWMVMATALSLGYLIGQIEGAGHRPSIGFRNRVVWLSSPEASRIVLTAAAILVMAVSLVWTMSRSGIVSFACVTVLFGWLVAKRQAVSRTRRIAALGIPSVALFASVGWRGADHLLRWFGDSRDLESRFAAWHDGWRVFLDFPAFGTGLNTYGTAMLFYQQSNETFHLGSAHNDYLQLLAEGGLLVTIPAAIAVICLIAAIRRNLRAACHESRGYWIRAGAAVGLFGVAVQETAEFSLQIPANAFLFCTLAAIAMAPVAARANCANE